MSELLRSPKGKIGAIAAGGLLVLAAAWFLLVAPQRSKATELNTQVMSSRAELAQRRLALQQPSANVTVKPGDLFRLTKALPNDTDMPGILLDVNRLASRNTLAFRSLTPAGPIPGTGYLKQPVAVVVQGRFGNVSRFLGDLRRLVTVRGGRLDARGRIYSVSQVEMSAPDGAADFPTVQAKVTLNAYSFSAPAPAAPPSAAPSTTTDPSSSGTVAAGATP
jgi:Tfp pilus assembly protein PilO